MGRVKEILIINDDELTDNQKELKKECLEIIQDCIKLIDNEEE